MLGSTHKTAGIGIGMIAASTVLDLSNKETIIVSSSLLLGSFIGSILSDIDSPNSYIGRKFKLLSHLIHSLFGHRTITHSLLFAISIYVIIDLLSIGLTGIALVTINAINIGLLLGILSHILLDSFTVFGTPFLYPIIKKNYSFMNCISGKNEGIKKIFIVLITVMTLTIRYSI